MLKAVTGFTLPNNDRVDAGELVADDFTEQSIIDRLVRKGALVEHVEEETPDPEAVDPATEAVEPAPEVSEAPPSPTPKKAKKDAEKAPVVEEVTD